MDGAVAVHERVDARPVDAQLAAQHQAGGEREGRRHCEVVERLLGAGAGAVLVAKDLCAASDGELLEEVKDRLQSGAVPARGAAIGGTPSSLPALTWAQRSTAPSLTIPVTSPDRRMSSALPSRSGPA